MNLCRGVPVRFLIDGEHHPEAQHQGALHEFFRLAELDAESLGLGQRHDDLDSELSDVNIEPVCSANLLEVTKARCNNKSK